MKKQTLVLVTILLGIVYSCTQSKKTDENELRPTKNHLEINKDYDIGEPEWYLATGDEWRRRSGPLLFVKEIGKGKDTIVMLHGGWGAEHSSLIDAIKGLEDKFHFIFYDQRGSLRSPSPDSLITLKNHVKDLELLRKELGVSKLKIAAHSMGTHLASFYLQEYPENVKSLILIGMVMPMRDLPDEDATAYKMAEKEFVENMMNRAADIQKNNNLSTERTDLTSKEKTQQWKIRFASANIYYAPEKWKEVKGGIAFHSRAANTATVKSYFNNTEWDFRPAYKGSNVPISVINGSHDLPGCNPQLMKKWMSDIPNADIKTLQNAGHNSWIDQPVKFKEYFEKALLKE